MPEGMVQDPMEKYANVFVDACKELLDSWERGEVLMRSEADLRCHLFSECLRLMKERNFERPYEISVEQNMKGKRPDLTLGWRATETDEGERWAVVVEIKWVETTDKVTKSGVEEDMLKLGEYFESCMGVFCYLLLIDGTKRYKDALKQERFSLVCEGAIRPFDRRIDALLYGYNPLERE